MREQGRLTQWDDERGFGFITPVSGEERVFVHVSAFSGDCRPTLNDLVYYTTGRDDTGRARAIEATHTLSAAPSLEQPIPGQPVGPTMALAISSAFLFAVFVLTLARRLPLAVLGAYLLLSIWLFLLYGIDKSAAQRGKWRASEAMLHFGAVLGGWPGALVGQSVFRHKTKKQPFRTIFLATVVLNVLVLIGLAIAWPGVPV